MLATFTSASAASLCLRTEPKPKSLNRTDIEKERERGRKIEKNGKNTSCSSDNLKKKNVRRNTNWMRNNDFSGRTVTGHNENCGK